MSTKTSGAAKQTLEQLALGKAWTARGTVTFNRPEDMPTGLLQQILDTELPEHLMNTCAKSVAEGTMPT